MEEKGSAMTKFTSRKTVTLTNVLHVLKMRKNLVLVLMLSEKGFKFVSESNMFIFTKPRMYVGKWYLIKGLLNLNVMVTNANKNNNNVFACFVDFLNLWHAMLRHVSNKSTQRVVNINLL